MRLKPGTKKRNKELADKVVGKVTEWTRREPKKKPVKKEKPIPERVYEPEQENVTILEEFTRLPEEAKIDTAAVIKPVIPTPEELAKSSLERLQEAVKQKPVQDQLEDLTKQPEPASAPTKEPEPAKGEETGQDAVTVTELPPEGEEGAGMEVEPTPNKYGLGGTDLKMSDGSHYRPKIRVGKGRIIAEMYFLVGDMPYLITELMLKISRHPIRNFAWPVGAIVNKILPENRITTFNWRGATFELDTNKVYRVTPRGFCCWYWIQLMEPRDVFPVDPNKKPRHEQIVMGTSGTSTVVSHLIMGSRVLEKYAEKMSQMGENKQAFTTPVVILLIIFALIAGIFIGIYLGMSKIVHDVVPPNTPVFSLIKSMLGM